MHILDNLERREGLDGRRARLLGILKRQVSHLVRLVDDILEASRITTGKIALRKEIIDLNAVAIETSTVKSTTGQSLAENPLTTV